MTRSIAELLRQDTFSRDDLITLLSADEAGSKLLFDKAREVKYRYVGNKVWFRGLIEYSNHCSKNCFYCGIRAGNHNQVRYELTDQEVIDAAMYAYRNDFASIVIQSGERSDKKFTEKIESLLKEISLKTNKELHITLSLGEQDEETYQRWLEAGAQRYLLRIETSNPELYRKIHPDNHLHRFETRIKNLELLRKTGYMVGTGVMIGLPFQTIEDLAGDLIFMHEFDVDMVGMGPYIEHKETPLYKYKDLLMTLQDRLDLSLKMVAVLRIMMKDINIAATTAMQTIDPRGREKALRAGANVMMPNITPLKYKQSYLLYNNKPGTEDDAEEGKVIMEKNIHDAGEIIGYGEWGDPRHFRSRQSAVSSRQSEF
jgi:biotin synthase